MEEPKRFNEILRDAMDARDYTIEKLASVSGVAEQFIRALVGNEPHAVPASTYARGYINKIAKLLEVGPDDLWRAYEREYHPKSSGAADLMPQNRFAIAATNKRLIIGMSVGVIIVIYALASLDRLIGTPRLTIINPKEATTISKTSSIVIKGAVENPKDTLTVNNVGVAIGEDGFFEHEVRLDTGTNTFVISVKRFLGNVTSEIIQVDYEPPEPATRATSTPRSLAPVR